MVVWLVVLLFYVVSMVDDLLIEVFSDVVGLYCNGEVLLVVLNFVGLVYMMQMVMYEVVVYYGLCQVFGVCWCVFMIVVV